MYKLEELKQEIIKLEKYIESGTIASLTRDMISF